MRYSYDVDCRVAMLAALLGGCGRIGFEAPVGGKDVRQPDAGGSRPLDAASGRADAAGVEPDAAPAACDWSAGVSFGEPRLVSGVNSDALEIDPYIAPGGDLYLSSDRDGNLDIFVASPEPDGSYAEPRPLALSSSSADTRLELTSDGLTAYFASNRPGGAGESDLYTASRAAPGDPFGEPVLLDRLNSSDSDYDPHLADGDRALYYAPADRPDGVGSQDIFVARRASTDEPFGDPQLVPGLNTSDGEADPKLSADGRVIVYVLTRGGTSELYYATRDERDQAFGPAQPLDTLPISGEVTEPYLSRDGCTLLFNADGPGGTDLYAVDVVP